MPKNKFVIYQLFFQFSLFKEIMLYSSYYESYFQYLPLIYFSSCVFYLLSISSWIHDLIVILV